MFRIFIDAAKTAAGAVISKYVIRASVAVPFLAAGGFATAAATLMLVERFGPLAAYWAMAGVFAVVGTIATLVVSAREQGVVHTTATEQEQPPEPDAGMQQAAAQLPLALLGMLLTTPFGPAAAGTIAKTLVRHLPLALLVVLIGVLVFAPRHQTVEPQSATTEPEPAETMAPSQEIDRKAA